MAPDEEYTVDVTAFIEKMVLSELYGKDQNMLTKERKEEIMSNFKKNVYDRRKAINEFIGPNQLDRAEYAEHYLNCYDVKETETSIVGKFKNAKLKVLLYRYNSNPIFKDTDFDGVPDGYGYNSKGELNKDRSIQDKDPMDNIISGDMQTNIGKISNANTHMDYRYFFMNNKNYYDELSTMSLMICNTLENNGTGTKDLSNITTLFRKIGMKKWDDTTEVVIKETKSSNGKIKYVTGINEIEYTHNHEETTLNKKVKLIAIKSITEGSNINLIGKNKRDLIFKANNHELFENLAKSIFNNEYEGNNYVYWITGHGTGGAVANILSAMIIEKGAVYISNGNEIVYSDDKNLTKPDTTSNTYITFDNIKTSKESLHNQVISNVYAYTFGSPYTIYNGMDNIEEGGGVVVNGQSSIYCSIFNVMNEDDILTYLPSTVLNFSRYGVQVILNKYGDRKTTNDAINYIKVKDGSSGYSYEGKKDKRTKIEIEFNKIFSDKKEEFRKAYTENTSLQNCFKDIVITFMSNNGNIVSIIKKITKNEYKLDENMLARVLQFAMVLSTCEKEGGAIDNTILYGKDQGAYYYLSKAMLPENITMMVENGEVTNARYGNISRYIPMSEALKDMGEWYCSNVYTYDSYSYEDFERNNNAVTFSERFQYDYDRASEDAKRERDKKVAEYNKQHIGKEYKIENFTKIKDYNLDLETFVGNHGASALYNCEKLQDDCYNTKEVGDDCSAFTLATMYYATQGEFDNYDSLNIYDISSNILSSYNKNNDDRIKNLDAIGFEKIAVKNGTFDELKSGDILVSNNHCEFYYKDGEVKTSFGWGSVKSKFPNKSSSIIENKGCKYFTCKGFGTQQFKYIYRLSK